MSQLSLRKGFAFVAALLLVGAAVAIAVATHGSADGEHGAWYYELAKNDERRALARSMDQAVPASPRRGGERAGRGSRSAAAEALRSDAPIPAANHTCRAPNGYFRLGNDQGEESSARQEQHLGVDARRAEHSELPGRPHLQRRGLHDLRPRYRSRRRPELLSVEVHGLGRRRRRRGLEDEQRALRHGASWTSSPARSKRTRSARSPTPAASSTPEPASRTPPATPRPAWASTSRPTAATPGRSWRRRSARSRRPRRARAASNRHVHRERVPGPLDQRRRGRPDESEPSLCVVFARRSGVSSVTGGATTNPPARAAVRPLQVDGRRRDLQLHLGRRRRLPAGM